MEKDQLIVYLRDLNQKYSSPILKKILQELLAGKSLVQLNPDYLKQAMQFIQQQPNLLQDRMAQTFVNTLANAEAPLVVNPNVPIASNPQGAHILANPFTTRPTLKPPGSQ